jgi:hypothetical protein
MTSRSKTIAFLIFLIALKLHAAPCDMNPSAPAQHVFAQIDSKHPWAEYKTIDAVPELSTGGGVSAEVWASHNGSLLVKATAPAKGYKALTTACFTKAGNVTEVAYELRTDWGWYYKAEGPVVMYRFRRFTEQYFDSKTDQPLVVSPQQPDDNPKMLQPWLYLNARQLPFANLLGK